MEDCVRAGLVRNIGVSNFNSLQIQRVLDVATVKPCNLQVRFLCSLARSEHRFPAPSSKLCQSRLPHWRGTLYINSSRAGYLIDGGTLYLNSDRVGYLVERGTFYLNCQSWLPHWRGTLYLNSARVGYPVEGGTLYLNSARVGYSIEGVLFTSTQLSTDAVSALGKVWVLIRLWKLLSIKART